MNIEDVTLEQFRSCAEVESLYFGLVFNNMTQKYERMTAMFGSPILARNRALECARNSNHFSQQERYDLDNYIVKEAKYLKVEMMLSAEEHEMSHKKDVNTNA